MPKLTACTGQALLDFLESANYDYGQNSHDSMLKAALWWAAYRYAEFLREAYTAKDLAYALVDGGWPTFKTLDDLDASFELVWDVEDDEVVASLEADLREFFNLPTEE